MFAGHETVGFSLSFTVTVKEQVAPVEAEVQVTVVVPLAKTDPEGGVHATVPQVSPVVGAV